MRTGRSYSTSALIRRSLAEIWLNPFNLAALVGLGLGWLLPAARAVGSDLTQASVEGQNLVLVACVLVYLSTALAATRARRFGVSELERAASSPQWLRTMWWSFALATFCVGVLVLAGLRMLLLARGANSVGSVIWWELGCSALTVLAAAMSARAVGSISRGLLVPMAVLGGFVVVGFIGFVSDPGLGNWTFGAGINPFVEPPLPSDALGRPGPGRAAWLLSVSVACLVFLVGRGRALRAAALIVLVLALGAEMLGLDLRTRASDQLRLQQQLRQHPSQHQTCQRVTEVTYCYFAGFQGRIAVWNPVVLGVLGRVPAGARGDMAVVQYVPVWTDSDGNNVPPPAGTWLSEASPTPVIVPVSTRWPGDGSGEFGQTAVAAFAFDVAYTAVTGVSALKGSDHGLRPMCQSQALLVYFLAAVDNPGVRQALETIQRHSGGDILTVDDLDSAAGYGFSSSVVSLAERMIGEPERYGGLVTDHWTELADPATTLAQASSILGLPAPAGTVEFCT